MKVHQVKILERVRILSEFFSVEQPDVYYTVVAYYKGKVYAKTGVSHCRESLDKFIAKHGTTAAKARALMQIADAIAGSEHEQLTLRIKRADKILASVA